MGKNRDISECTVAQIIALRNEGLTQVQISQRLNINQSIVSRALKRHVATGQFGARTRPSRPRFTNKRTDLMIFKRIATITPTATSSYIKSQLPPEVTISTATIRRRLHDDFKLRAYRPASKPLLSKKNIKDRIAFCKRYERWTVEMWRHVLFFR